ncbi:MAG TPA: PilN domain-containing protein [Burkholderiaceae bacterium]|nr:PilN domain-containing protein [Burkholderiaceae bacterium]
MSQQINLFNPIFLKQEKYFSAITMVQALGLILLGSALLVGYTNYQMSILDKEAQSASAQLALVQAQLNKINIAYGNRQKDPSLDSEVHKTEMDIQSLRDVFDILKTGEFGDRKGYAEYMRAFARQSVGGVWLTGFALSGAGNEIELQGRALQPELVPAYIRGLKREPVLQGKSFAMLEMKKPPMEPDSKEAPSAEKPHLPVPYIEFSLQSSGAMKEQADASGVRSR